MQNFNSIVILGLFHKAALLSGSTISSWAINYDPAEIAFRFGKELGIETRDTAVLMNKLSEIDAEKLVMASEAITKQEVCTFKNSHQHFILHLSRLMIKILYCCNFF